MASSWLLFFFFYKLAPGGTDYGGELPVSQTPKTPENIPMQAALAWVVFRSSIISGQANMLADQCSEQHAIQNGEYTKTEVVDVRRK